MRPHHKQYIRLLDVIQADRGGAALRAQSSRHPADSNTKGSQRDSWERYTTRECSSKDVAEANEKTRTSREQMTSDGDGCGAWT